MFKKTDELRGWSRILKFWIQLATINCNLSKYQKENDNSAGRIWRDKGLVFDIRLKPLSVVHRRCCILIIQDEIREQFRGADPSVYLMQIWFLLNFEANRKVVQLTLSLNESQQSIMFFCTNPIVVRYSHEIIFHIRSEVDLSNSMWIRKHIKTIFICRMKANTMF